MEAVILYESSIHRKLDTYRIVNNIVHSLRLSQYSVVPKETYSLPYFRKKGSRLTGAPRGPEPVT